MILRTITCSVAGCDATETEKDYGKGWDGWLMLQGVVLNDDPAPSLCPHHMAMTMDFIDSLEEVKR